jgi:phosphoribosylaminoimidazole-succinocarboxamide synthase
MTYDNDNNDNDNNNNDYDYNNNNDNNNNDNDYDNNNNDNDKQFPHLCIPRVHLSVTKELVFEIINKYSFGSIEKIDVIKKKGSSKKNDLSNMVFIYFKEWYNNTTANSVKDRLMSGKDIKIIYDDPWYWKISAIKV